jgi:hypothetical protein
LNGVKKEVAASVANRETSSGITAREPQQNPVLVFSITLMHKRVRPPVWIILVLHAASVRALLVAK